MDNVLRKLTEIIRSREDADPKRSYVASLIENGEDYILKKLGEEAAETIIAGKNDDVTELVNETADLWFHSLVLLRYKGVELEDVLKELESRFIRSGFDEKRERKN